MKPFSARYALITKQAKVSNRLAALRIDDGKGERDDDYEELDRLTKRINKLAPIVRRKDRDDEAKVGFLTKADKRQNRV